MTRYHGNEVLSRVSHAMPDLAVVMALLLAQLAAGWWLVFRWGAQAGRRTRILIASGVLFSAAALVAAFLLGFSRFARHAPEWAYTWGRGITLVWALLSSAWVAALAISRGILAAMPNRASHSPARRNFLRATQAALFGAPTAALGYGVFVQRFQLAVREQRIIIPDLPPDLDGLRLVQLTDIHLSAFVSKRDVERAVAMANEIRPHLALVTGDLITSYNDPLDDCLEALSRLRAEAGILGCLGNHEYHAGAEDYTTREGGRLGLRFLRHAAEPLVFGKSILNVAGVDYQQVRKPYLRGTGGLIVPGAANILLSHNPDVFPVAARQGYDLTVSGHTHGGQVRVEILGADLNVARFYTPFVDGLYRQGKSSIFVSRGIGTIGVPARLGAPPEVALLQLCRS